MLDHRKSDPHSRPHRPSQVDYHIKKDRQAAGLDDVSYPGKGLRLLNVGSPQGPFANCADGNGMEPPATPAWHLVPWSTMGYLQTGHT